MYECNARKMSQHQVTGTAGTGVGVYGLPGAVLVVICLKMYLPFLRLSLGIVHWYSILTITCSSSTLIYHRGSLLCCDN